MKIYVSALLLTIGIDLDFCVSSSMPSSSSNQPTARTRYQRMYIPRFRDRPVFNKETGALVAIFYNEKRIKISDMVFEEKDPDLIPDDCWLWRVGPGLHGIFYQRKIYYLHEFQRTGVTFEPETNDLVVDPSGFKIKGIFRDHGRYDEIVARRI